MELIKTELEYFDGTKQELDIIKTPRLVSVVFPGNISAFYKTDGANKALVSYVNGKGAGFMRGSISTTGPSENPSLDFLASSYILGNREMLEKFALPPGRDLIKKVLADYNPKDEDLSRDILTVVDSYLGIISQDSKVEVQEASSILLDKKESAALIKRLIDTR